eukprot:TRINITY_DN4421_c0_g1_i1.p1 TRINITY_DN4421_c0_g1~~TRINITY_DN4421_c0_g1_i1.p1  ORF type:complete len:242 (-),score=25.09 TRINITY_DN4421_c0_g1_i1:83-808(-)
MVLLQVSVERWWIFDEPASVFFSALDLFGHAFVFNWYRNTVLNNSRAKIYPYHWLWILYSVFWTTEYFFSCLFHSQSNLYNSKTFESLDYFGVTATLMFMNYAAIIRIFEVRGKVSQLLVGLPFLLMYSYYVHSMCFVLFDYGWHVKLNIYFGILHTVLWSYFCLHYKPYKKWCLITILLLGMALPLEIFDFPDNKPLLGVFDSHSLWHGSGFPMIFTWHYFLIGDARFYIQKNKKSKRKY